MYYLINYSMNLVPFTRSELEEDWGIKVKDLDNIYCYMYSIILMGICFSILLILTSLLQYTYNS